MYFKSVWSYSFKVTAGNAEEFADAVLELYGSNTLYEEEKDPTEDRFYYLQWYYDNSLGRYATTPEDEGLVLSVAAVNTLGLENRVVMSNGYSQSQSGELEYNGVSIEPGIDINILPTWEDYTGSGVNVVVQDLGFRMHPDIMPNMVQILGREFALIDQDINGNAHATFVAGVIGGSAGVEVGEFEDPDAPLRDPFPDDSGSIDHGTGAVGIAFESNLISAVTSSLPGADPAKGTLPIFDAWIDNFQHMVEVADALFF